MQLSFGRKARGPAAWLVAAAVLVAPAALADSSASLAGAVTDAQGRPIAGAMVTVSGEGVRPILVLTDAEGRFRVPGLRPSAGCALAVAHAGYRTVEYYGLDLEPGRTRVIDFRLKRPGERDVVILASRDPFPYADLVQAFMGALEVPVRLYDLDADADPASVMLRLQAERPNLIVGAGLRAARLIRRQVREIPAILTLIDDPRRHDLRAPNLCSVSNNASPEDLLARLASVLPAARRIGIVYDAEASSLLVRDLRAAARRRGMTLVLAAAYRPGDLERALDGLLGRIDALAALYDPLTAAPGAPDAVAGWSLRHRIPLAAPGPDWVRRGALYSYGATQESIGMEAAWIAGEILFHGRQPSEFEHRDPKHLRLAVNRGTAEALGVAIPPGLSVDLAY